MSDFTNNSIYAFDASSGAHIRTLVPNGAPELSGPRGITVDAAGNLYVAGRNSANVMGYNAVSGALAGISVASGSGGLGTAGDIVVAPDGNLLVSSSNTNQILRYDGTTGVFLNEFAAKDTTDGPLFMTPGADGNLYVGSFFGNRVDRYNMGTGAYIGPFASGGGLSQPWGVAFGPDGHLYVSSGGSHEVLRYDGASGSYLGAFVPAGSGGLNTPRGLTFGPDGNLYVTSNSPSRVLRYDGNTGAFLDEFVGAEEGLHIPMDLTFVPDSVPRPPILRWEYEATVVEIVDPAGVFPGMELGDPVRGSISYDLAAPQPLFAFYLHGPGFQVATMVIENPRASTELQFMSDEDSSRYVTVQDDFEAEDLQVYDFIEALQSVLPPGGFTGTDPVVVVGLYGSPDVISNSNLPSQIDLEDWPLGVVSFYDYLSTDTNATAIHAEIFSLTAVPSLPGDFDSDGDVDTIDYAMWKASFGRSHVLVHADTNGNMNGVVDAADYVVWRDAFSTAVGISSRLDRTVPEPATSLLLILAAVGGHLRRRPTA